MTTSRATASAADRGRRPFRWPALLTPDGRGIAYGGDYNPDQWPEGVWDDDIRLMHKAGVNTVALGIFSWARIQPAEDTWDFDWLDRVIGKLGAAGIAVDLASATASAPMWLYEKHPEVLPRDKYGHVVHPGSRQSWRPTSPVFRGYALELCRRLARRYGDNPTVTAWHMGNEYGWNNRYDYSDDALAAFRAWCEARYGTVDALNEAWGTAFWSQHVNSFDEVLLPCHMGGDAMVNPAQQLDFERFGNDMLLDFYKAERDAIAAICPGKPFTTNFMVSTDQCCMDYAKWAGEVDFVSNDHYFHEGESHLDELVCSDALVSALALGKPWYLMEHSTSAVQWKPVNARKRHGELVRDALAHVAMGADAINFFQWRQSASGAEAFHSAMVPHAGEDSKIFREVCELGAMLRALSDAGLQGSELERADTAILFSAESEWATRSKTLPSMKLNHWHDVRDWYRGLLDARERADVVPLAYDWSGYRTVVLPSVLVLSDEDTRRIAAFVRGGGRVVVGYATGLVDERFRTGLGGYPGADGGLLRDILGVRSEECNILGSSVVGEPDTIALSNAAVTRLWQNDVTSIATDTQVLATYAGRAAAEWELDGVPAVTRHPYGDGEAYYVGCDLDRTDITRLAPQLGFGVSSHDGDPRIIHTVRRGDGIRFDCYLNRANEPVPCTYDPSSSPVVAYRCESNGSGAATIGRNGVLIVSTVLSSSCGQSRRG
ncbi:beta-galactosidase [Bifidobacterium ramosum]|uniref:Beta-galactosidase n=1 Tax=Bifidobacterium ramosum TaxID=1798158 RepID=A0A6L4X284_9BIFI|nr:beta-galactosidase [Bifidobacterium ramosum]KAB8288762.1 beta-galactosidase [Bifidobacterium ramosum]NEG71375.1 beta-galactosidase [Bifidobacterium ramosum]